jgi:DNA-binding response OmpR family regulator
MKVMPVFTRINEKSISFWEDVEALMANNWTFRLYELEDALQQSIYGQCIIADISIKDLNKVLYFQRTFSLPFLYVNSSEHNSDEILEVLGAGAIDALTAPLSLQVIKAKILHYFDGRELIKNERLIFDASLTKIEEQILRVILSKSIKTSAENIFKSVWKEGTVQMKTFNVHISKLRKKLRTIDLDIKCLKDKSYHVIKKRTLQADIEKSRSM